MNIYSSHNGDTLSNIVKHRLHVCTQNLFDNTTQPSPAQPSPALPSWPGVPQFSSFNINKGNNSKPQPPLLTH